MWTTERMMWTAVGAAGCAIFIYIFDSVIGYLILAGLK
jgi:hypothetical protein